MGWLPVPLILFYDIKLRRWAPVYLKVPLLKWKKKKTILPTTAVSLFNAWLVGLMHTDTHKKYTYPSEWQAAQQSVRERCGIRRPGVWLTVNMYLFNIDKLLIRFLLIVTLEQSRESTVNRPWSELTPVCCVQDVVCVVNTCIESRHTGASSTLIKRNSHLGPMEETFFLVLLKVLMTDRSK